MIIGDKRYFNTDCAFYYEYSDNYKVTPSCIFRYEHNVMFETNDYNLCKACPHSCPAYTKMGDVIDKVVKEKMKDVPADYDFVAAEKETLGESDIRTEELETLLDRVDLLIMNELNNTKEGLLEKIRGKIYETIKGVD